MCGAAALHGLFRSLGFRGFGFRGLGFRVLGVPPVTSLVTLMEGKSSGFRSFGRFMGLGKYL